MNPDDPIERLKRIMTQNPIILSFHPLYRVVTKKPPKLDQETETEETDQDEKQ